MDTFDQIFEQFKVAGKDLAAKVKELIHEGNVRRIIVKNERGLTFMEIPLTVAAIGAIAAPVLAAVGAIAGMVAHFTVVVERTPDPAAAKHASQATDPSMGAMEEQVDMSGTVSQKVQDESGTGKTDAPGG